MKKIQDEAYQETEQVLSELEKKIRREYAQATKESEQKLKNYLDGFAKRDAEKQKLLDAKQITQDEYNKWRTGQMLIGQRWEEMNKTLATDLANASELARSMTEGYMPEVYALNHNYATFQVEKESLVDTSYTLYNKDSVERLIRDNPKLLPAMSDATAQKIREGKLIKWNEQHITSALTQGILQGESIDKLSKRLRSVAQMDHAASVRNARTLVTNSQNAGRLDGMKRAQDMGIKMKKQWVATLDTKTRHEHVELDGQRVDVDEPFVTSDGDEIDFPGDDNAEPYLVYNCRCSMISVFDGFDKNITDYDLTQNEKLGDMTYEEWKEEKWRQEEQPAPEEEKYEAKLGDTAKMFSTEKQEEFQTLLSGADNNVQKVWVKASESFKPAVDREEGDKRAISKGRAYYRSDLNQVVISKQGTANTYFHEYGHNADYTLGDNKNPLSLSWRSEEGKTFEEIITDEWKNKFYPSPEEMMWANFEGNLDVNSGGMGAYSWARSSLNEWAVNNNINRRDDERYIAVRSLLSDADGDTGGIREIIKNNIDIFSSGEYNDYDASKFIKENLTSYISNIKDNYSVEARGDLSDMLERYSVKNGGPAYPLGVGHGKDYALIDGHLGKETFAEMFSAEITSPESLELIKQELPEAYSAFRQMIGGIL